MNLRSHDESENIRVILRDCSIVIKGCDSISPYNYRTDPLIIDRKFKKFLPKDATILKPGEDYKNTKTDSFLDLFGVRRNQTNSTENYRNAIQENNLAMENANIAELVDKISSGENKKESIKKRNKEKYTR